MRRFAKRARIDPFDLDKLVGKLRSLGYSGEIKRKELEVWFHLKSNRIQAFLNWIVSSQDPLQHSFAALTPTQQHIIRNHLLPNGLLLHGKQLREALRPLQSTDTHQGDDSSPSHSELAKQRVDRLLSRKQFLADAKAAIVARKERLEEAMGALYSRSEGAKTGLKEVQATVQLKEHEISGICAAYLHPARVLLSKSRRLMVSVGQSLQPQGDSPSKGVSKDAPHGTRLRLADFRIKEPVPSGLEIKDQVTSLGEKAAGARKALAYARVRNAGYTCEVEMLRSNSGTANSGHKGDGDEYAFEPSSYDVTQKKLAETLKRISKVCSSSLAVSAVLRRNLEASMLSLKAQMSTLQRLLALFAEENTHLERSRQLLAQQIGDVKQGIGALNSIQHFYTERRNLPEGFLAVDTAFGLNYLAAERDVEEKAVKDYTIGSLSDIRRDIQKHSVLLHSQYVSGVNSLDRVSAEVWKLKAAKERLRQHVVDINAQHEQIQRSG